jgi:hypothetical protein
MQKKISLRNIILSVLLLLAIIFSVVRIIYANSAIPNPGHDISTLGGYSATGDLLYGTNGVSGGVSGLADVATGNALLSNGVGAAPAWGDVNLANTVTGLLPVTNGGNGAAPSGNDQVLVSDSASAGTWRTLPSCSGNGKALRFNNSTNTFDCNTLQFYNQSVATLGPGFAADTYLTGSSIPIPSVGMQAGTRYHLVFQVSKTAAGTLAPTLTIHFGTAGTTGDASRCAMTFAVQTAVIDTGTFDVWATFRTIGAGTAVIQCVGQLRHNGTAGSAAAVGLGGMFVQTVTTTGGAFDSTVANSIIGTSVFGNTNAVWTITLVQAELTNLN